MKHRRSEKNDSLECVNVIACFSTESGVWSSFVCFFLLFFCGFLLLFIWCRASKNVQTVFPHYFDFILTFPLFNRYSSFGTFDYWLQWITGGCARSSSQILLRSQFIKVNTAWDIFLSKCLCSTVWFRCFSFFLLFFIRRFNIIHCIFNFNSILCSFLVQSLNFEPKPATSNTQKHI